MTSRLERIIGGGLLSLLALMPFHAFLTVWLGTLLGHRSLLQSWKEVLLLGLTGLTAWLVVREPARLRRLAQPAFLALGSFAAVALVVTAMARPGALVALFGIKTDLEFTVAAAIAVVVGTPQLLRRAVVVTLAAGSGVVAFGLVQIFLLPANFLTHFGYGPNTILPFETLDPAIKSLRFGATLGGPNQLGAYLTLIIALSLALAWRRRWWLLGLTAASLVVLIHTYSRAAWVGVAVAGVLVVLGLLRGWWRRGALLAGGVVVAVGLIVLPQLSHTGRLQYYLLHGASGYSQQRGSDFEHLVSLQTGAQAVLSQPIGHGLGTAGPTAFYAGTGRVIENYYLQLGYETGLLGMGLFIVALVLGCWSLLRRQVPQPLGLAMAGAVTGVSINALVLPAWTDSTTALVIWILVGLALARPVQESRHV